MTFLGNLFLWVENGENRVKREELCRIRSDTPVDYEGEERFTEEKNISRIDVSIQTEPVYNQEISSERIGKMSLALPKDKKIHSFGFKTFLGEEDKINKNGGRIDFEIIREEAKVTNNNIPKIP